jgi:hypothetical protein
VCNDAEVIEAGGIMAEKTRTEEEWNRLLARALSAEGARDGLESENKRLRNEADGLFANTKHLRDEINDKMRRLTEAGEQIGRMKQALEDIADFEPDAASYDSASYLSALNFMQGTAGLALGRPTYAIIGSKEKVAGHTLVSTEQFRAGDWKVPTLDVVDKTR